jgi:sugar lactone lactonase YvrE
MKLLTRPKNFRLFPLFFLLVLTLFYTACTKDDDTPKKLVASTVTQGVPGSIGIEVDAKGNIWATESGTATADSSGNTHNDNGKVVLVTPDGKQQDAIINLSSYANAVSHEVQGTVHLMLDGTTLYILSGDYLYHVDISAYKFGDAPIDGKTLEKEDVASVVRAIPGDNNPDKDSHPYNMTKGPNGDIYIADAGANAIVHRTAANQFSVLATFPALDNPLFPGLGGPKVQVVPTSIRYDGSNFLVTALTGFPFPQGKAVVYKVSPTGAVSTYQSNFTALVDQAAGNSAGALVLQHSGAFVLPAGFDAGSGAVIQINGTTATVLQDSLALPTGIKQVGTDTWYITSLTGKITKLHYE